MVCTSRFSPSLIHGLCEMFASTSRFMRLFQPALDTCLDSPLLCQPLNSWFALHTLRLQSCGPATQWKTGRTTKMGKNGKNVENLPRLKMGKKWPKNTEKMAISARFSIFSVFFGHFFPIFDRGKFSTFFFPIFSHFCRSARFPLCSRPARLQLYAPSSKDLVFEVLWAICLARF